MIFIIIILVLLIAAPALRMLFKFAVIGGTLAFVCLVAAPWVAAQLTAAK